MIFVRQPLSSLSRRDASPGYYCSKYYGNFHGSQLRLHLPCHKQPRTEIGMFTFAIRPACGALLLKLRAKSHARDVGGGSGSTWNSLSWIIFKASARSALLEVRWKYKGSKSSLPVNKSEKRAEKEVISKQKYKQSNRGGFADETGFKSWIDIEIFGKNNKNMQPGHIV